MTLNRSQHNVYLVVMQQISIMVDAPDEFDEKDQRELYKTIGNECLHRAHAIDVFTNATKSPADARNNVRQALRELSAAVGEVEGLAEPGVRLQAAFTLVAALFPHKEEL